MKYYQIYLHGNKLIYFPLTWLFRNEDKWLSKTNTRIILLKKVRKLSHAGLLLLNMELNWAVRNKTLEIKVFSSKIETSLLEIPENCGQLIKCNG